jgi:hypothetical protein
MEKGFYGFPKNRTYAKLTDSASYATTASYSTTASYAMNGGGGGNPLAIYNKSSALLTAGATSIQFTGNGQTATAVGNAVTVNIPAAGGSIFPYTGSATITGSLVVTGSVTATMGFTGSLFGTASWATRAITASFLQNNDPNGLTLSVVKGITLQATDTSIGFITLQAKNIQLTGSTGTTITAYGNILPGGPYTNNTSSFNLGSPTAAWKDIFVSNGSINFISGSASASIQFNNGQITFPGAIINIPTGSIIPTSSFATTSSFAQTSLIANTASFVNTLNQNVNITGTLTAATIHTSSLYTFVGELANDIINSSATVPSDVTGLSFSYAANSAYNITVHALVSSSINTTGHGFSLSASSAVTNVWSQHFHQSSTQGSLAGGSSLTNNVILAVSNTTSVGSLGIPVVFFGYLRTGANTGTCTLRFRSELASTTVIKSGSIMFVQKII